MWNNVAEVTTVLDFFRLMVPVTLLRRGPERVPYSQSLLVMGIALCTLLTIIAASLAERPVSMAVLTFAAVATFYAGAIFFLLTLYGVRNRALQTLTAAFGVGAVFGVVELFLLFMAGAGVDDGFIAVAALALQLWAILVDGFIISGALNISLPLGCLLSFSILLPQVALVTAIGGGGGA